MEDVRTIKVGLYRDLVEVCMLLESSWDAKNVPEITAVIKKLKDVLVVVRHCDGCNACERGVI